MTRRSVLPRATGRGLLRTPLLAFVLLLASGSASAGEPCRLDPANEKTVLGDCVAVLYDRAGTLSFEEVSSGTLASRFGTDRTIAPGTAAAWVRIDVVAPETAPVWCLTVYPYWRYTVFAPSGGATVREERGLVTARRSLGAPNTTAEVRVTLTPDRPQTVWLRISTAEWDRYPVKRVGLSAVPASVADGRNLGRVLQLALVVGALFALALYNLSLFFFIRDRAYLAYALSVVAVAVYVLTVDGWLRPVFQSLPTGQATADLAGVGALVFFIAFTRGYLGTAEHFPRWDRALAATIAILTFFVVALVVADQYGKFTYHLFKTVLFAGAFALLLVVSVVALRSGYRPARLYFVGNLTFLGFGFLRLLGPGFFGVVPFLDRGPGDNSALLLHAGVVSQVLLFSVALGSRVSFLRDEVERRRLEAAEAERQRILEVQQLTERKAVELEEKVAARTDELNRANQQLVEAQEKLAELMESSRLRLDDVPSWAAAVAQDLKRTLGLDVLTVYEVQHGNLSAIQPAAAAPAPVPALSRVLESLESPQRTGDDAFVPVRGLSGELRGVVAAKGPKMDGLSTHPLLTGFASQLGSVLEMVDVRRQLAVAETARAGSLAELHERGIETLELCPSCGRCYRHGTGRCADDDAPLEVPGVLPLRLLDRYRFIRLLGEGGMGKVFEARDEKLDRTVAVKLMRTELFRDAASRLRFEREARTLGRLHHPGVVTVHDSGGVGDGSMYLVMERLEGLDLGCVVDRYGPGAPAQVARLLRQGGEALDAAHRTRVVHRDVKPENIFLVPEPDGFRVKFLDFGLAKSPGADARLTRTGFMIGTPAYMAPEQLLGQDADTRSDLFAFATVVYEALVGQPAAGRGSLPETIRRILRDPVTPPSFFVLTLPPDVDAAFLAALAKMPEERPRDLLPWAVSLAALLEACPASGVAWPDPIPRVQPREAGRAGSLASLRLDPGPDGETDVVTLARLKGWRHGDDGG